ncbi:MAG: hypothetical protein Q9213_005746 [Squamulea squamosa]
MRLLLTSILFSLPLASLAALEEGGASAEPTTTLYSTSTQTLTKTLAGNTVTSTLPSGESTTSVENLASITTSAEGIPTTATSESSAEGSTPVASSIIPATTSLPFVIVSTSFSSSTMGAPYPILGSSNGNLVIGTAGPTGTGAPITPAPPGIEPFKGAASKLGGQDNLLALAAVLIAGMAVF